jgi:hypothetical protein
MTRAAQLAQAAAGGVLQVVNNAQNVQYSTTSSSDVDTGFNATITPKLDSSKVLITFGCGGIESGSSGAGVKGGIRIYKNGVLWKTVSSSVLWNTGASAGPCATILDTPSTTSPITYSVWIYSVSGYTFYLGTNTSLTSMTLMEIAG